MNRALSVTGILSCLLLSIFIITGCGGGGGDGGSNFNLSSMDISDAKALIIAPQETNDEVFAGAVSGKTEVLYKLTDEGLLIEVTLYDSSGNEISSQIYPPEYIEDINEDYIFVTFGGGPWPPQYFVNKNSGAVFQMQNEAYKFYDTFGNSRYFKSETSANILDGRAYYQGHDHVAGIHFLRRIEFDASGILSDTKISPVGDDLAFNQNHGPSTAVSVDGTILYSIGDNYTFRLISKDGRVIDLAQEIFTNQPDMRPFILGEIPGYYGGFGDPFVGTDGAIHFKNSKLGNFGLNELYLVAMPEGVEPEIPPDPTGEPITLVYDKNGNGIVPHDPISGLRIDLRNPLFVDDYGYRPSWDWWHEAKEWAPHPEPVDANGNKIYTAYDEEGKIYYFLPYTTEIFAPVWRLTESTQGDFTLEPYGNTMATNHYWLPDLAPEGFLYYDSETIEKHEEWWEGPLEFKFLHVGNKVIMVDVFTGKIFEVNNPTKRPVFIESASYILTDLEAAESTDTHYYLLGRAKDDAQISLYRFDANTHTPIELIDGTVYEIYKFTVTNDNEVVFRGVRRSDGADIGGIIDFLGNITVNEEIQNRDIVELIRVL